MESSHGSTAARVCAIAPEAPIDRRTSSPQRMECGGRSAARFAVSAPDASRGVAPREHIDFGDRDAVVVAGNRLLERARGDRELQRLIGFAGMSGAVGGMLIAKITGYVLQTAGSYLQVFPSRARRTS